MNLVLKKRLARRTLLKGLGTAIALPMLDAMAPALATAATPKAPSRMAILYFPNGVQVDAWWPKVEGKIASLPPGLSRTLEPLEPYRQDISLLGGLTVNGGRALGDGGGDHGRAGASYLTGVHPRKTYGKDIQTGVSMDQVAARKLEGA